MIIETDRIDDYCAETEDCRACTFVDENGECKYRTFLESYEYMEDEIDDSDYETLNSPICYFCGKTLKSETRRKIPYETSSGNVTDGYVCMTCFKRLKLYYRGMKHMEESKA